MLINSSSLFVIQDKIQDGIITLFLCASIVYISRIYKKSFFATIIVFVSLLSLVNLIPIHRGSSMVQLVRGVFGDVSIASGVLLIAILYKLLASKSKCNILSIFELSLITAFGVILYLSAFGFISFDLYNYGYIESATTLFIFVGIILALLFVNLSLGYIWLFAFITYYFRLLESHNFWDYLIDPIFWLLAIGVLIIRSFKSNN